MGPNIECKNCEECSDLEGCINCYKSWECGDCLSCAYSNNCYDCSFCLFCSYQRDQKYMIGDKQYSKQKFFQIVALNKLTVKNGMFTNFPEQFRLK
jgi:hypothetical protein